MDNISYEGWKGYTKINTINCGNCPFLGIDCELWKQGEEACAKRLYKHFVLQDKVDLVIPSYIVKMIREMGEEE